MLDGLPSAATSLRRSLQLGYRAEPRLVTVSLVTTLAAAVPDAFLALALSALVGASVSHDGTGIVVAALSLGALATGGWLLGIVSDRVNVGLTDRVAVYVESHMARLHAEVPTIAHHERSEIVDRLTLLRDQAATLSELYQMLFSEIGVILRLLITVGILISIKPVLALLCLFAIPPVLVSNWRAGAERRAEESVAHRERLARSLFMLGTTADAAKEVRTAQVQQLLIDRSAAERAARYRVLSLARARSTFWLAGAYLLFGAAFIVSVGLAATGKDAVAQVVLLLAAGSRLSVYLSQAVRETHFFRTIWLDGSRRLAWLEDYAAAEAQEGHGPAPVVIRDGIRLDKVSFTYPGGASEVLTGIELFLPAGSVTAIVGENGTGKTTLVKLLCGLYQPTSGRITVDGEDLRAIDPSAWRSRITSAFQDFVKFEYPVRESVGLGNVAQIEDRAAVTAALRRAGAQDLVATLADGLETQLGASWAGGTELSHGQWQKISLARSFMLDEPLVVVLDEPTSAIDAQAEQEIFDRYAEAGRDDAGSGRITVLVSHRFSTVRTADLIVVLDGARIVEIGSHAELMARPGTYAELFAIQASGYASSSATGAGPEASPSP
jgi:ATP-binding cassette, subfamily B, bacterial